MPPKVYLALPPLPTGVYPSSSFADLLAGALALPFPRVSLTAAAERAARPESELAAALKAASSSFFFFFFF